MAKKRGMNQVLEITGRFLRHGRAFLEKRGGLTRQRGHEGQQAVAVETQFFSFLDEFGEIHVGGEVLLSGVGQRMGRRGVLA